MVFDERTKLIVALRNLLVFQNIVAATWFRSRECLSLFLLICICNVR